MATYNKHTWRNREEITAAKLNHMEEGIEQANTDSSIATDEDIDALFEDMP